MMPATKPAQTRSVTTTALCGLGIGVLIVGLSAASAHAGGFAVSEQSAVAGGTGGAGTARAGDASAAWYNPAALADGGGLRLGLGVLAAMPSLEARALDGSWQASSESAIATPPHLFASFARGRLAGGLAVGVPFGGGVTWPEDWAGRNEIVSSNLLVFRIAPFVAYRLGRVRLAAGPHLDVGRLDLSRSLDFVDTDGDVNIGMSGTGVGVHVAAFATITPAVDVGLSYKSRTSMDLTGGADFTAPTSFSMKIADQHASTSMTLPDRISLGARYRRGDLSVLADADVTFWGVYDEVVIDFERDETPDVVEAKDWSTTVGLRAGAEYVVAPAWTVRGGAFYDPSPAGAETLAPSSPDSDRLGVTAGGTFRFGRGFAVDAFYELMALASRDSGSMESLPASYSGSAQLFGVGVRYEQ